MKKKLFFRKFKHITEEKKNKIYFSEMKEFHTSSNSNFFNFEKLSGNEFNLFPINYDSEYKKIEFLK